MNFTQLKIVNTKINELKQKSNKESAEQLFFIYILYIEDQFTALQWGIKAIDKGSTKSEILEFIVSYFIYIGDLDNVLKYYNIEYLNTNTLKYTLMFLIENYEYQESIRCGLRILELEPNEDLNYFNLGTIYQIIEDFENMIKYFMNCYKLKSNNSSEAISKIISHFLKNGEQQKALDYLVFEMTDDKHKCVGHIKIYYGQFDHKFKKIIVEEMAYSLNRKSPNNKFYVDNYIYNIGNYVYQNKLVIKWNKINEYIKVIKNSEIGDCQICCNSNNKIINFIDLKTKTKCNHSSCCVCLEKIENCPFCRNCLKWN